MTKDKKGKEWANREARRENRKQVMSKTWQTATKTQAISQTSMNTKSATWDVDVCLKFSVGKLETAFPTSSQLVSLQLNLGDD